MKIISCFDTKSVQELPGVTVRDVISAKDGAPRFVMRVFELEPGAATHPHAHWWEHEVYVLSGKGMVAGERERVPLEAGSVIYVPPEEPHYFVNNGNELLRYVLLNPLNP